MSSPNRVPVLDYNEDVFGASNEASQKAPQVVEDAWSSLEKVPFAQAKSQTSPEEPLIPHPETQPPQESPGNQEIESTLHTMREYLDQLEGTKTILEDKVDALDSTIDRYKDTMKMLEDETKAPGEAAGSLKREKSNVVARFKQKLAMANLTREKMEDNLGEYLETIDTDILVDSLGKELVGKHFDELLPYSSAEELFSNLTDEGVASNLDALFANSIKPETILDRLDAYQVIANYDTLEKNGAIININEYIDYPKGVRIPHEVIARNIDYLIERGAKFDSLLHRLSSSEVISNLDKLMKMDGASVEEVENHLFVHKPGPMQTQKYMEALRPYR